MKQDIRKYLTLRSDSPFPLFPCFPELVGFEEPWCCSKSFLSTTVWTGLILPMTKDRRLWYHALGSLGALLPAEQGAGSIWDTSYSL